MSDHGSMISDALFDLFAAQSGGTTLRTAYPGTVAMFDSGDAGLGTYPVNNFGPADGAEGEDLEDQMLWLAIGTNATDSEGPFASLVGPYPQFCAFADMSDGWFFGDGTFDSYLHTNADGYAGVNFSVKSNSLITWQGGGVQLTAIGGSPGNGAYLGNLLEPRDGNSGEYDLFGLVTAGIKYAFRAVFDYDTSVVTVGFFGAASAQATHVAPASVTAEQLGQILIDYGLMAAA